MIELVVGDMGISIPTEEAISKLQLRDTEKMSILAINLDTLIRNAMGSTDTQTDATIKLVTEQVIKDVFLITEHMMEVHEMRTFIYWVDYRFDLPKKKGFASAEFKLAKTARQLQVQSFHETVRSNVLSIKDFAALVNQVEAPLRPDGKEYARPIFLTHVMADLLDHHYFEELKLLESRTGAIKSTRELFRKINSPDDKREFIPFNTITLQVYGDNSGLFQPVDIRVRRAFTELATSRPFNPNTTVDRINFCLKEQHDPALKELMKFYR